MEHFMLTPHELVEAIAHSSVNSRARLQFLQRLIKDLWNSLWTTREILGGRPVVRLEQVENHCSSVYGDCS